MTTLIPQRESLTVEFKSDAQRLSDDDLVQAIVCLANTEGGDLYLGIEDDGRVTGLHTAHRNLDGLPALIANNTVPSVSVRVERLEVDGARVAHIQVPRMRSLVATAKGTLLRRRLKFDGAPECTPFLPHEFGGRQADLGLLDPSALPVPRATLADLDPAERLRLRSLLERYKGDAALVQLADEELDAALNFSVTSDGQRVPTLTGLLLLGREEALRRLVPTHELVVQVLDGTEVRFNKASRAPLLRAFEELLAWYEGRRQEQEVSVGLFRVSVPNVEPRAFREAVVNALSHRDYGRLGAVRVAWEPEQLTVSSPGGFVEGVTTENILRTEPRPRNPSLADALKRIGLAERTGRGVDLMFASLLRFGRSSPDYGDSGRTMVVLHLSTEPADLPFLRLVLGEEERRKGGLPLDTLLVLARLKSEKRLALGELQKTLQRSEASARGVVEKLVEADLLEAHGSNKGRTYTLSARVYRALGQQEAYVRQAGIDPLRQAELVRKFVKKHGQVRRSQVMELCGISGPQATRLMARLVREKALKKQGIKRGTVYRAGSNL